MSTATTLPAAGAPSAPATGWIVSPTFDGWFFMASGLVVIVPLVLTTAWAVEPWHVLVGVGIASNGPHLASTWTRVYLDLRELRERPLAYAGVPVVITAAVVAIAAWHPRPFALVNSVIVVWATWHFASQCYGLMRIYQSKSREPWRLAHRAESAFIFFTALSGLTWRLHQGPVELFGETLLLPIVPLPIVAAAFIGLVASALVITVDRSRRAREGEPMAWRRLVFLATVLCAFWVPFMLIQSGTAAFAAAACWHGLQYIGIVFHYNRRKFTGESPRGARLIAWASQPGRWPAYAGILIVLAGSAYGIIEGIALATGWPAWKVAGFSWTALTLSHYWLDGLIWKIRKPQVASTLLA